MKKSEMIQKIQTVLDNLSSVKMSNKLRAQAVLTEIENAGMKPPKSDDWFKYEKDKAGFPYNDPQIWDEEIRLNLRNS